MQRPEARCRQTGANVLAGCRAQGPAWALTACSGCWTGASGRVGWAGAHPLSSRGAGQPSRRPAGHFQNSGARGNAERPQDAQRGPVLCPPFAPLSFILRPSSWPKGPAANMLAPCTRGLGLQVLLLSSPLGSPSSPVSPPGLSLNNCPLSPPHSCFPPPRPRLQRKKAQDASPGQSLGLGLGGDGG